MGFVSHHNDTPCRQRPTRTAIGGARDPAALVRARDRSKTDSPTNRSTDGFTFLRISDRLSIEGALVRHDGGTQLRIHHHNIRRPHVMRYMLLIYSNNSAWANMDEAQTQQMMADYGTFTQEIVQSGELLAGDPLQGIDTATSVRVRDGRVDQTDGPFAETKEVLGGYYIVDVPDLDRATALAAKIPDARYGTVEVRPIQEMPG
jgi:hypothetical protein